MSDHINPFHELYVTETARPEEFVQLFSDLLVPHALLLFQPGNVIVKGTQGSGKSMLLSLLTPEIRCAYVRSGQPLPVPDRLSKFITGGINLTSSGILDVGQRPIKHNADEDERLFPLFFADYLNYWIVRDILRSFQAMRERGDVFPYVSGVESDAFARLLAKRQCWFGYLSGVTSFDGLKSILDRRIAAYRSFHLDNISRLPDDILETKTSIGEPISQVVDCLWQSQALERDVPLFVRIDQHEVLSRSDDLRPHLGIEYRRIVNKALSTRDPRVSYRIGTRRHAWRDDLSVYGTAMSLEILRDYRIIDMDDLLRRKEDPNTWIFPKFAEDIFRRRLEHAGLSTTHKSALRQVMGRSPKPSQAAKDYVGSTDPDRALKIEAEWPDPWKAYLREEFRSDPLSAKLAEAWLRQRRAGERVRSDDPPPEGRPWGRIYWRKERTKQALFQLAARCAQRPMWSGTDSILSLCMGGTLIFVSVCQHIWDAFLRSQAGIPDSERLDPIKDGIPDRVQKLGIFTASAYWYQKIAEQPGGGERRRFIDYLGRFFYNMLVEDRAMSYPGHNGFSLSVDQLEADQTVSRFLSDAVDYGDLHDASHTTKESDRRQRIKWYLNPILSPYFRLPESHVKEPLYVDLGAVRQWLADSGVLEVVPPLKKMKSVTNSESRQLQLLPAEDEEG